MSGGYCWLIIFNVYSKINRQHSTSRGIALRERVGVLGTTRPWDSLGTSEALIVWRAAPVRPRRFLIHAGIYCGL